jgi:hypothetical protein
MTDACSPFLTIVIDCAEEASAAQALNATAAIRATAGMDALWRIGSSLLNE